MQSGGLKWSGRSYGGKFGNRCFALLLRAGVLPAYALLVFVAAFFMFFRRRQCAESGAYLARALGRRVGSVSWAVYRHLFSFGVSILDRYAYFAGKEMEIIDECKDAVMAAREAGRGAVLVVSHIGGWAIAGGRLAEYECPTGVIGVSREHAYIREMEESRRSRASAEMIADASEPMSIVAGLALLRRNGLLAMHGDRYMGGKFAPAEILGGRVRLPTAAYILAARSGAPVISVFCVREGLCKYRMFCSPPRVVPDARGKELEAAAAAAAQAYAGDVERALKKYPYQWYNFYPFWEQ